MFITLQLHGPINHIFHTGYTFHQQNFLSVTESGCVVLDSVAGKDSAAQGEQILSQAQMMPSINYYQTQNCQRMLRDIVGQYNNPLINNHKYVSFAFPSLFFRLCYCYNLCCYGILFWEIYSQVCRSYTIIGVSSKFNDFKLSI